MGKLQREIHLNKHLSTFVRIALLLFIGVHAFNIEYHPVARGLDPSWQYIINDAAQRHLEFSFTSGPLGFINYPVNLGANLEIATLIRLMVWICFCVGFGYGIIKKAVPVRNVAVFALCFGLGSSLSFDYLLGFVSLFLLCGAFLTERRWWFLFYGGSMALSAVLGLIKLSAAMLTVASCCAFLVAVACTNGKKAIQAALMTFLGIPLLFVGAYLLYDPSWSRMAAYIRRGLDISAGYNVAMSVSGDALPLWLALGVALLYAGLSGFLFYRREKSAWLGIILLPSLFFAFKHGFVRQDGHEVLFFLFSPLPIGLIWLLTPIKKTTQWALSLLLPFLFIMQMTTGLSNLLGIHKFLDMRDIIFFRQTKADLDGMTATVLQEYRLPPDWLQSMGDEPVSIFPWETAYVPANGLHYQPFPIIQAYTTYTAYLDNINATYLTQPETAPQFLLSEWFAMNNRHALLDVPAMWLAMYQWYDSVYQKNTPFPLVLLKRRSAPRFEHLELIERREFRLQDFIEIPASDHPIVMKLRMPLNFRGMLAKVLFRVPEVTIDLVGTMGFKRHRIVPDTLANPLLINMLPIGLQDVYMLLDDGQVQGKIWGLSFSGKGLSCYRDTIRIEFYRLPELRIAEQQLPDFSTLTPKSISTESTIERMDRYVPGQSSLSTGNKPAFLIISGWAIDSEARDTAGGVYLLLDGKVLPAYYGFPRDDIATRFNNQAYRASGFQAGVPLAEIGQGPHSVSLSIVDHAGNGYYTSETVQFEIR